MTSARKACRDREPALALYVEGDLPEGEVAPLEAHLTECAGCRELLRGLRESQASLHTLATEPIDEAALDVVRRRVRARLAQRPAASATLWRWSAAASVLLVAGLIVAGFVSRRVDPSRATQATLGPSPTVPAPSAPVASPVVASTTPPKPSVVRRASVARSRVARPVLAAEPPEADVPLTSEEADQLARAVVLLSRIEKVEDFRSEDETAHDTPPAATVRLATADPNVVIYWQFESNGG
jgi:hypothetical protein